VGTGTADDAGVYLITPDLALVQTVDLLTPVVPDAYTFGQIAAANSLSDVYAMGGEPKTVLNIIGFPAAGNREWLVDILRGAQDKVVEAGACVVGGHTFNDPEIKFGLSVTGVIDRQCIITNAGARVGDQLVLTKPLGTGTLSQALMMTDGILPDLLTRGIEAMRSLNREASRAMVRVGVNSATDVTGFGLVGHLQEMCQASGVAVRLRARSLPLLPGVLDLVRQGIANPGIAMNMASFASRVTVRPETLSEADQALLQVCYESQNSGGLLIAVSPDRASSLQSCPRGGKIDWSVIGEMVAGPAGNVTIEFD
jgi:selenide,water dikinase